MAVTIDDCKNSIGYFIEYKNLFSTWLLPETTFSVADNHVHALVLLSATETASHLVEEIKRNSSRWIKTLSPYYERFSWQSGYAAFSVSQSLVEKTTQYITHQEDHHRKRSFKDEYLSFLELYNIRYDERYVFSD